MKNIKGLTASFIFEAESANYGEGLGNVTSLKKISRGTGEAYSYISRQALRYNIISQMGADNTPLVKDKTVIQFDGGATIEKYPEIDLFGYMSTEKDKGSKIRSAVVRLSNAIALESYNGDLDFLTNKGLFDRYSRDNKEDKSLGGNIAQSEIHRSFYTYTIAVDLDRVGIDDNDNVNLSEEEKAKRVNMLLEAIKFLYRDIKGRRENFSPIFAIGGVYDYKNPFFENKLKLIGNDLNIDAIEDVFSLDEHIKENTLVGAVNEVFNNTDQIKDKLGSTSIGEFFKSLEEKVNEAYKG